MIPENISFEVLQMNPGISFNLWIKSETVSYLNS